MSLFLRTFEFCQGCADRETPPVLWRSSAQSEFHYCTQGHFFNDNKGEIRTFVVEKRHDLYQLKEDTGDDYDSWAYQPIEGVRVDNYSPDASMIATGHSDGTVRLWDPVKDELLHVLTEHTEEICHLSFSPNGRILRSEDSDWKTHFWNVDTGDIRPHHPFD